MRQIEKIFVQVTGDKVTKSSLRPFAGAIEVEGAENVAIALNKRAVYQNGQFSLLSQQDHRARIEAVKAQKEAQVLARWNASQKTLADKVRATGELLRLRGISEREIVLCQLLGEGSRITAIRTQINGLLGL